MQRIMSAQALRNNNMMAYMKATKILEINPSHSIIADIKEKMEDKEQEGNIKNIMTLLYEIACLSSGFILDDPSVFSKRMYKIIGANLSLPDVAEETTTVNIPTNEEEVMVDINTAMEDLD
jgi:molecular chaperone HtpG